MAYSNTIKWRVRAGSGDGSDSNGGGFDPAVSGALSTTLNGAISAIATTITVASAAGWPSSGSFFACISVGWREPAGGGSEIVLVTAGQGTTTWTVSRNQLGTAGPAGGFPSGATVNNDLSRCATAASSGTAGSSS